MHGEGGGKGREVARDGGGKGMEVVKGWRW